MSSDSLQQLLSGLTESQREVALHRDGPLLVIAGAGSGKTRALTHRVAALLHTGIPAWQVLAVTFTNKAAEEMRERIGALLGPTEAAQMPFVGTFHRFGGRVLRRDIEHLGREKNFSLTDADDGLALVKRLCKAHAIDPKTYPPRQIRSAISRAKNAMITPEQCQMQAQDNFTKAVAQIFAAYEKALLEANSLDFDDLLLLPLRLFSEQPQLLADYQNRFRFIMVDEFQDVNEPQFRLLRLLAGVDKNLAVIGDADQSIYAFRGAQMGHILGFEKHFPGAQVIRLEENFRNSANILQASNALISQNSRRLKKQMRTDAPAGEPITVRRFPDERAEADFIAREIMSRKELGNRPNSDFAILVRTNAQTRAIEERLLRHAIPYTIIGGLRFYARREVRDLLAYLRLLANPKDDTSFRRIVNVPARKIGAVTLGRVERVAAERGLSLLEVLAHLGNAEGISTAARAALLHFSQTIFSLSAALKQLPLADFIEQVMKKSGLENMYDDGTEEGEVRVQNLRELCGVAKKFDGVPGPEALPAFLEEVALLSDADELTTADRVNVMTMHAAKGLEFPVVFVPGFEEGLLPHSRSAFEPAAVEEERRLVYVAMTRAREALVVSHADSRMGNGDFGRAAPSRFLGEIPAQFLDRDDLPARRGTVEEDGLSYVYDDADTEGEPLHAGDRVRHAFFGEGIVCGVHFDVVEIEFPKGGRKKFALSVAPLERIP